jgi:AraC-like DNA-binding protein
MAGVIEGAIPWGVTGGSPHQALMRVRGAPCLAIHTRRDPAGVQAEDGDLILFLEDTLGGQVRDVLRSTPTGLNERDTAYEEWPIVRPMRLGGPGAVTRLCGASFEFDDVPLSVRAQIRPLIVIPHSEMGRDPTLVHLLDAFEAEVSERRDAQPIVIARLLESILLMALRCQARERAPAGFSASQTSDRYVGKAFGLLHELPRGDWSVSNLASSVGLSRRSFARRFARELGEAPREHLSRRRMAVAVHLLETTDLDVGEVAVSVGYESDAAFCRAFKRRLGTSPKRFREAHER